MQAQLQHASAVGLAREHGIRRAMPLAVAGAFHSALMAPAADRLRAALDAVTFKTPRIPVWSNVTGKAVTSGDEIPDLLVRQLTSPVRWADCLTSMQADGDCRQFWELGPGKTICGMISRTLEGVETGNLTPMKTYQVCLVEATEHELCEAVFASRVSMSGCASRER